MLIFQLWSQPRFYAGSPFVTPIETFEDDKAVEAEDALANWVFRPRETRAELVRDGVVQASRTPA